MNVSMTPDEIIGRLLTVPVLQDVPREELAWLVARGEIKQYPAGTTVAELGTAIEEMAILLEGKVALFIDRGGVKRRFMDATIGNILGVLPYSRARLSPGNTVVEEDGAAFTLHTRYFPAMIHECPELTTALVHHMLDRASNYRTAQLKDDKLQSLGRLASGLAHELNNPASAATRNAHTLAGVLEEAERAAWSLAGSRLSDDQLKALADVRSSCATPARQRSAIETADREDDITEWLTRHNLTPVTAEALTSCEVTIESLDRLARVMPADALGVAIRWVAGGSAARMAARQIETATGRIHELVTAVRGFTFMDREVIAEDVDIKRGLTDTIAILEGKARKKSVTVRLETADDLPRVFGVGSEINQVWNNLIDNAIDAVDTNGVVSVTASPRGDAVVVRVSDNGHGIPDDIRDKLFEPFFTTKAVGQGTGLGLDTTRRAVHLHGGDIDFTSQPGRTVFRVKLPIRGAGQVRLPT